jgi:hypothetical protein
VYDPEGRHGGSTHGHVEEHKEQVGDSRTKMERIREDYDYNRKYKTQSLKMLEVAEADLKKFDDLAFDFNKHIKPALDHSIKGLKKEVSWADETTRLLVNAEDVKKAFSKASQATATIYRSFPKAYESISNSN